MNMPVDFRNSYHIFHVVFKLLYSIIRFWREHNGNAATLPFCVIRTVAPYTEHAFSFL